MGALGLLRDSIAGGRNAGAALLEAESGAKVGALELRGCSADPTSCPLTEGTEKLKL